MKNDMVGFTYGELDESNCTYSGNSTDTLTMEKIQEAINLVKSMGIERHDYLFVVHPDSEDIIDYLRDCGQNDIRTDKYFEVGKLIAMEWDSSPMNIFRTIKLPSTIISFDGYKYINKKWVEIDE